MIKEIELHERLIKLRMLFELSDKAFNNYLEDKFYLHALCIKKSNHLIYEYILDNAYCWPKDLQMHLINLLNHFDIWFTQFSNFEIEKDYKLNEPFVFFHLYNKSAYPKNSVDYIKSYNY